MRMKIVMVALAATAVNVLAFSTGPPIKRTGVIDGGANCSACHRDNGPANSDPAGSVTLTGASAYVPGSMQLLHITISHPSQVRWGFQLTARFVSDGKMAGTFTPADDFTRVQCDDGSLRGSAGPCAPDQLAWIEHGGVGGAFPAQRTAPGVGTYTYNVNWMPPENENGDIIFYFAGNAANGDGNLTGDHIYTNTFRISVSPTASCGLTKPPAIQRVVNAAPHAGAIAPNGMVEIYGSNFQNGSRTRNIGLGDLGPGPKFVFPTQLSCIAVEIDGQRAPVTYVQQDQINVQAPTSTKTGPLNLVVIANPGRPDEQRSVVATVTQQSYAPAFFTFDGKSIAAQQAGKADIVANPDVVPGAAPAKPGDIVTLYGSGFGFSNPVWQAGEVVSGLAPLSNSFTITIGGVQLAPSDILYGGLAPQLISGVCQFNVRIPASVADGDQPVIVTIAGVASPSGATIPVKR